jgi:hypothetical protein
MKTLSRSKNSYEDLSNILYEFDVNQIRQWDNVTLGTLISSVIVYCVLKVVISSLIKRSVKDNELSDRLSDVVYKDWNIRYLKTDMILSFSDDKNNVFISQPIRKFLNDDEMIALTLHEVGHGAEKLKEIAKDIQSDKTYLKWFLTPILKKAINTDAMNMTSVYILVFLLYYSTGTLPRRGVYKWSYGDLAIRRGYFESYVSAMKKLDRKVKESISKSKSKLASRLTNNLNSNNKIASAMGEAGADNIKNKEHSLLGNVSRMLSFLKQRVSKSQIIKFLRDIGS